MVCEISLGRVGVGFIQLYLWCEGLEILAGARCGLCVCVEVEMGDSSAVHGALEMFDRKSLW